MAGKRETLQAGDAERMGGFARAKSTLMTGVVVAGPFSTMLARYPESIRRQPIRLKIIDGQGYVLRRA